MSAPEPCSVVLINLNGLNGEGGGRGSEGALHFWPFKKSRCIPQVKLSCSNWPKMICISIEYGSLGSAFFLYSQRPG